MEEVIEARGLRQEARELPSERETLTRFLEILASCLKPLASGLEFCEGREYGAASLLETRSGEVGAEVNQAAIIQEVIDI